MTDVESKVIRVIQLQLDVDPDKVKPEAHLANDLGADLLQHVELILAIEEKFHIAIPDDEAKKLVFVSDVIEYVRNNL